MHEAAEEIRLRWAVARDEYDRFRAIVEKTAKEAMHHIGLSVRITSRTKTIDSLVRKALKQIRAGRYPTFDSIFDKVGIRIVVQFKEEVEEAVETLKETFRCTKIE